MEKACIKCGKVQNLDNFYCHPKMKDGHLGKCKSCSREVAQNRYIKIMNDAVLMEKEKERHRIKYYRLGYKDTYKPAKDKKKQQIIKHKQTYPEKYKAKIASARRVKLSNKESERHHWSYNEEHFTDTLELSVSTHKKLHRYLIYDQKHKMYRRSDNNKLLNTKDLHIDYLNEIIML